MESAFGVCYARSVQTLGLPPPTQGGPENSGVWYHEHMQMPDTRVRGYFGVTLGSDTGDDDVQLFFYNEDQLEPIFKMVINKHDLMAVFASMGKLLHERLGLLSEWNLAPARPNGA